jgi:hypothetical protein
MVTERERRFVTLHSVSQQEGTAAHLQPSSGAGICFRFKWEEELGAGRGSA